METTRMHGLQQYVAFAETAKHGGFAAAARSQGVTPSTLAKAVARLERQLGLKLFHRTTRQVTLTPDGERLYRRCQRVLAEIEELQAEASGASAEPAGVLHIDLPVFYGKRFVMPVLVALLKRHPALRLNLRFSDRIVDLVRDGRDFAVRMGALADSSLVARRIGLQSLLLCASPAYLRAHGTPRRIADLAAHAAIAFRLPTSGRQRAWQLRQRGAAVELLPEAVLAVDDTESLSDALRLGLGICQVPDNVVQEDLARGELVEVLPGCRPEPMPINVVYPSGRLLPARVRVAIDALCATSPDTRRTSR